MTKSKKFHNTFSSLALLTLLVIGSFMLISCTGNADVQEQAMVEDVEDEVVEEPVVVEEPTAIPIPDQSEYYAVAKNVYDLGKGPNTACSGCHSPFNWDPEATRGPAPSCWTCKFPQDAEVRIAENNPLVLEEDWEGIPCKTCHMVDENGTASDEYYWFNQITQEYDEVATSTELCEKCHVTTTGNAWGSGVDHKITLGGSAHLNYSRFAGEVAPPQVCTDCHNPHDTEAKPACDDCHSVRELDTHILGNNAAHWNVSCMACHDSTGLDVGPSLVEENAGLWVTQFTEMGRSGPKTEDVVSHSPTHEVLCNKCHIEDSPHGLPEFTEDGEVPEVDICVAGETLTVEKPTLADHGTVDVDYTMGECPAE